MIIALEWTCGLPTNILKRGAKLIVLNHNFDQKIRNLGMIKNNHPFYDPLNPLERLNLEKMSTFDPG